MNAATRQDPAVRLSDETIQSLARFPQENPNPVLRVAATGQVLYANRAAVDLLEACSDGRTIPSAWEPVIAQVLQEGTSTVFDYPHGGRAYACSFIPITAGAYVNVYVTDVTEQRQAVVALRESEARYRAIFGGAPIGIVRGNLAGEMLEYNSTIQTLLGYSEQELCDRGFLAVIHPDDVPEAAECLRKVVSEQDASKQLEVRFVRQDGQSVWTNLILALVRNAAGGPQFILGMVEDISDRRTAERLQRERAVQARELARAREIQERLLPATLPSWPGQLEVAVRFRSALDTSGDLYDVIPLAGARNSALAPLQIAVGDVAGKGLPAALVMAEALSALRTLALQPRQSLLREDASPATTMRLRSQLLHRYSGPSTFVACALAVVEPPGHHGPAQSSPRLRLANAAQVPPLLYRGGEVTELEPPGVRLPLGIMPEPQYEELVVDLQPGDVVVFTTDGLAEAPAQEQAAAAAGTAPGELFGFERLTAAVARAAAGGHDAEAVASALWAEVLAWSGEAPQHDDMTLLVVRVPSAA
ncbi:MAG: hypothetical protein CL878_12485 [Dehalococcoidia bacterium]|nr:hypothetical protein [Dehalococcoidia bacterium]